MRHRHRTAETGSALVITLVFSLMLAGFAAAYLTLSYNKDRMAGRDAEREQSFRLAESAISRGLLELNADDDLDGNGTIGSVTQIQYKGGVIGCQLFNTDSAGVAIIPPRVRLVGWAVYPLPPNVTYPINFADTNTYPRLKRQCQLRQIEAIVDDPTIPFNTTFGAALTCVNAFSVGGNAEIDGRNWRMDGSAIVPNSGVKAGVSGGAIGAGGSSTYGGTYQNDAIAPHVPGTDQAMTGTPGADLLDDSTNWAGNGLDDNRNGVIDEAGEGPPTNPDQALGLPSGQLKDTAIANGTYFTTAASFNTWKTANGGEMPPGSIVYIEMPTSTAGNANEINLDFGTSLPSAGELASVLVIHNAAGNATAKNVNGQFAGFVWADEIDHVNAGGALYGAAFSLSQGGNVIGNGNFKVRYSSEALNSLPPISVSPYFEQLSWREVQFNQ